MELQRVIDNHDQIPLALRWASELIEMGLPAGPVALFIGRPKRTLEQNRKLWPMLHDVANQVEWYGQKLTAENFKDMFTAALKKQKAVPGIDGGFVVIGGHTSKMNKQEFSELLELIAAFGAEHGVEWSND